ncbi:hypothetical protein [Arthrobacter sp. CG_A4]|uniref:hypothetical protein n=1 Tax=Arthrobacter sp. CG_A4 TaxID=3071706 RepID=UPI002E00EC62|nr:hypothetical protein [Arthrobacter sp. CG_A4]
MTSGNTSPPQERSIRTGIKLGLRQNLAQFLLLVAVNALTGGTRHSGRGPHARSG